MRNTSIVRTNLIMAVCAFLTAGVYAQGPGAGAGQRGQRGEGMGQFGQMDPERMAEMRAQMQERRIQGILDAANVPADEATVIRPRLEKVMAARDAMNVGAMGGMMGGGRQGGQAGAARFGGAEPTAAQQQAQTALETGEGFAEAIKALREERAKQREELEKAVEELMEIAPLGLQLRLMMQGIVD